LAVRYQNRYKWLEETYFTVLNISPPNGNEEEIPPLPGLIDVDRGFPSGDENAADMASLEKLESNMGIKKMEE